MDHLQTSSRNLFTDYDLDRVHQHWRDAEWLAAHSTASTARFVPTWRRQHLMVSAPVMRPVFLSHQQVAPWLEQPVSLTLLGIATGYTYFGLALSDDVDAPALFATQGRFLGLRQTASLLSRFDGGLLAYAGAMAYWHHTHRFCGTCGYPTASQWAGHVRVCTHPECKQQHFPRTDPAIIVRITWEDQILLGRQPHWTPGRYSNIAGFVAPGESLEDAVRREAREEANVEIKTATYYSSQPWPFPRSLMLGFTAKAASTAMCIGEACSDGELEAARWFTHEDIRQGVQAGIMGLPSPISISFNLIADWFDAGNPGELAGLKT